MNTKISFAQFEEDLVLMNALSSENMEEIFYIDVGANDAIDSSVTFLFYLLGARGINIEPQMRYLTKYQEKRPEDITLSIGIGNKVGEMEMFGDGQAATFDKGSRYAKGNRKTIKIDTLENICDKYIKGREIHFLKIDVEGFEKQCIEGLNFQKYRPWILCVESYEPGSNDPTYEEWESILIENNYCFAYKRGVNRYYGAMERKEVVEKLKESDSLDSEVVVKMGDYQQFVNSINNSMSFKITAPLRNLKKCFMRLAGK